MSCCTMLCSELVLLTEVTCPCLRVKGILAAWVCDECDATGQQRTSAVLFSRAFRSGSAACGGASDTCVCPWLLHFCKQERLERLASALCWLLHCMGPVCSGRLCAPSRPGSSGYRRLIWGNTAVPPQLELIKCCLCKLACKFGFFTAIIIRFK